jgi:class 3 adenylate cyclase/pimeloyl-ACP methyl ester carboxylesterase
MEPRIQYGSTADGVSIAFCEGGEGTPFIEAYAPFSHIELEWREWEWHRIMASRRRLIRFDNRGSGHSQRDITDFSVEAMALDIGAVADALKLETFVLYGEQWSVPIAIAYAARHPERVSKLCLYAGYARGADFYAIPRVRSLMSLLEQGDWELFSETLGLAQLGWQLAEVAHMLGEQARSGVTLEQAQKVFRACREHDVTETLARLRVPTLVMHPRGATYPTLDLARQLAAGIPGARLKVLESETIWSDEMEPQLLDALEEFIGDGGRPASTVLLPHILRVDQPAALATILFTDLASSTALTQRLGDAKAQELVRAHNTIVREALAAHGGTEIKHTGDGIMASFPTASGALECAVTIQRAVAQRNEPDLQVYIGLNAGEPVAEESDLFGTSVQLARRICDHASAGQILVSNVVRELAAGKGFLFSDAGEVVPKGFDEAVRLYELRWREDGVMEPASDG